VGVIFFRGPENGDEPSKLTSEKKPHTNTKANKNQIILDVCLLIY
jgi:hypothetical protein